jgi:16S rRNA (adenine1518-N6/adenine1519-N6)-dimethyltransferase
MTPGHAPGGARAAAIDMQRHPPRKRFGQNFLVDAHYVARIVDAIAPAPGDNVVEIGPGLAALTGPLIARAGHLTAIEIDRDLAARLAGAFPPERLTLHVADALAFDFSALGTSLRVVGNLPYNISTPLLFHLAHYEACLADLHVMLQKEVVARMAAAPATADYGRLTVMLQAKFAVTRLFVIPPGAFRPSPSVDSAVVRLVPLGDRKPAIADDALFARVVAAAFGHRRKTMRNALVGLCDADALTATGIDPGRRGETLAVADFVRLANRLAGNESTRPGPALTIPDPAAPAVP